MVAHQLTVDEYYKLVDYIIDEHRKHPSERTSVHEILVNHLLSQNLNLLYQIMTEKRELSLLIDLERINPIQTNQMYDLILANYKN